MPEYGLLPEQEELLRKLVEAVERARPARSTFGYVKNMTVAEDVALCAHGPWPKDSQPVYLGDLDTLADEGYIRRVSRGHGWTFELTEKAFRHYATVKLAQEANSSPAGAMKPESGEPPRPSPLLVLEEIRGSRRDQVLKAQIIGHEQFHGVDHRIGSRQLFFIWLLFRSSRTHRVGAEVMSVVTEDEASRKLMEWSASGFLKLHGPDKKNPKLRVRKMWGEFVRQIEKDEKLKGLFTSAHKDELGNKLYGLRLGEDQTQILVHDVSSLFRR